MDVMTFFLLTLPSLPSGWCMPAEWSQWSEVASQDGNDVPPGDGGDIVDDLIDGLLDDEDTTLAGGATLGGATLATLAGIAVTSGLIKAGIITTGTVASGLFGVGSWLKDHDFEEGVLLQNGRLDKGEELTLKNGKFKLLMKNNGNLVISHEDGAQVWSTNTAGSGSYFFFQEDGDLVVYDGRSSGTAVWNSGTGGQGGQKLSITENGFLALYGSSGQIIWKSCPHTLLVNQMLHSGYSMSSSNGNYKLSMQGDGDLVLYDISNGHNVVNWRTGPSKLKFDTYAMLQSDGNLVLRDQVHLLQWETMTSGSGATSLVLQDDGKLVLCCNEDGSAIWTNAPPNRGIFGIKANGFKANVIKHFGLGHEPLGNMNFGVKFEAMKHPKHTSQLMNSGEMKSEVLGENRFRVRNAWSVWSDFTACSGTCGPATKMRERVCTDPANPEITCEGPTAQIFNCDLPSCAEAGGWSAWSDVNACSATCGSATNTRKRTCNDLNGGLTCLGSSEETIDCNLDDCGEAHDILVVDGGWSAWSDLTTCSASCGRATKMRVRTCSDPEPMNGGLICQGLTEEIQDCNLDDCLVIRGGWSAWSDLGACTATCGSATKKMARTCTNPEPSDESLTCQGPKVIILDCELPNCPIIMDCGFPSCPIDGGWSTWSDFSSCTASCGPATKRRERICGNPVPANGGLDCSGLSKETLNCDLLNCAIFG